MTRNEGSALFLMWAYWDHPHPWTPSCPLISSKGQPFLPLSKHYCTPQLLCFACCFPAFQWSGHWGMRHVHVWTPMKTICCCKFKHIPQSLSQLPYCIQTLSQTSLFTSIHPNQVLLLPRSLSRWTCHLCVTSGFAPPLPQALVLSKPHYSI